MRTRLDEIRALVARASQGRLVRMWITIHDGETRVPTLQIEEGPVHDRRYRPASDVDWSLALRARDDLTFLLDRLDQATARAAALATVVDRLRSALSEDPYLPLPGGRDQHVRTQPDTWVCRHCGAERGRQEHDRGCFWQVAQGRVGPLLARLDGTAREAAP